MGSSPRVRGAVNGCARQQDELGIIPARAGSSNRRQRQTDGDGDHPRACGEQKRAATHHDRAEGSSPRVRGAADRSYPLLVPFWDHPRACGEQPSPARLVLSFPGSSPRVRGAANRGELVGQYHGIIPARAGSSMESVQTARTHWDHPRACGEQLSILVYDRIYQGSSPRVRGAVDNSLRKPIGFGIIPARAGSRFQ